MFKVLFWKKSLIALKRFIDSYKDSFIRLIIDSWLEVEDLLIKNYIEIGSNLYKTITDWIEKSIQNDNLLWRIEWKDNEKCLIIKVKNFRIFIHYSEDKINQERHIEKLEFFKK